VKAYDVSCHGKQEYSHYIPSTSVSKESRISDFVERSCFSGREGGRKEGGREGGNKEGRSITHISLMHDFHKFIRMCALGCFKEITLSDFSLEPLLAYILPVTVFCQVLGWMKLEFP
jgi:hypothetical protein